MFWLLRISVSLLSAALLTVVSSQAKSQALPYARAVQLSEVGALKPSAFRHRSCQLRPWLRFAMRVHTTGRS
jgi:hypothetical protein